MSMQIVNNKMHINKKDVIGIIILIVIGLIYGYILIPLGIQIECPLYKYTGLKCALCGITSICLNILHMRFKVTYYNYGLIAIIPIVILIIVKRYNKRLQLKDRHNLIDKLLLVVIISWSIIRNIISL